jgi:Cd2+/Zn2+-exporting ATPase
MPWRRCQALRSLSFQLVPAPGHRCPCASIPQALDAIRKAGFKPVPVFRAARGRRQTTVTTGIMTNMGTRQRFCILPVRAAALCAGAAPGIRGRIMSFFAPPGPLASGMGMALAAAAIALAGFSTYVKGLAALKGLRLNINALMTVAVTGAFLIGQWPEAAMVMALYAIAELIEARSVDRARNAIKGLLDMTPEMAEVTQADGSWAETPW